jgi:hypothetical protein
VTLCGCYFNRDIDETIETDRYTLHLVSHNMFDHYEFDELADTLLYTSTVPGLARFLGMDISNDTTMFVVDEAKQDFLPNYSAYIADRNPSQPDDYTPLLRAMMDRGILRADTVYKPLQLLELYDSARYARCMSGVDVDSSVLFHVEMKDGEPDPDRSFLCAISAVNQLRDTYRMPVSLGPGVPADLPIEVRWMNEDWPTDSLWLDSMGFRIVPDPQGRRMRIIEFNRCKGKL